MVLNRKKGRNRGRRKVVLKSDAERQMENIMQFYCFGCKFRNILFRWSWIKDFGFVIISSDNNTEFSVHIIAILLLSWTNIAKFLVLYKFEKYNRKVLMFWLSNLRNKKELNNEYFGYFIEKPFCICFPLIET